MVRNKVIMTIKPFGFMNFGWLGFVKLTTSQRCLLKIIGWAIVSLQWQERSSELWNSSPKLTTVFQTIYKTLKKDEISAVSLVLKASDE